MALWEKSSAMGCDVPVLYRNLAMAYAKDPKAHDKELAALETAVKFGGNAMVFNDLDRLDEENGVAPDKRLALMDEHQTLVNRDDVISREINLDIFAGKYDAAIDLLKSRFFRSWEWRRPVQHGGFRGSTRIFSKGSAGNWLLNNSRRGAGGFPGGAGAPGEFAGWWWKLGRAAGGNLILDRRGVRRIGG